MKKIILSLIVLFSISTYCDGQYTESFDLANKGILSGTCATNDPSSCSSTDFGGVTWTIGGDLSGIDTEGFSTESGYLHSEDLDEEACWISPTINITDAATSSFTVTFTIPNGASWENSTTPGSIDYLDVKYSVDGGAFITLSNVNGCPGSGHTLSGSTCSSIAGPQTFNISESGILGGTLDIQVCIDTNASSDDGHLEEISVPEPGTTLPVTWSSVDATKTERGNLIEWSTSTEINNDRYEVQRKTDQSNEFTTIGNIRAAGTSFSRNFYEYVDESTAISSVLYYRVKQVDYDGKYTYSKVLALKNEFSFNGDLSLHPNPVTESLTISVEDQSVEGIESLFVYNMFGQVVEHIINPFADASSVIYDTSSLSGGMYFIKPMSPNGLLTDKTIRFSKVD